MPCPNSNDINIENTCVEGPVSFRINKKLGNGFADVLYVYLGCFLLVLLLSVIFKASSMAFITTAVYLSCLVQNLFLIIQLGRADAMEWYAIVLIVGMVLQLIYLLVILKA